jgi:hypothetical protein
MSYRTPPSFAVGGTVERGRRYVIAESPSDYVVPRPLADRMREIAADQVARAVPVIIDTIVRGTHRRRLP